MDNSDNNRLSKGSVRFSELTKVRAYEFSKQLKDYYVARVGSSGDDSTLPAKNYRIYYDVDSHEYRLSNIDPSELGVKYVLIGFMSWERVMSETSRNNIRAGERYLYEWIISVLNAGNWELSEPVACKGKNVLVCVGDNSVRKYDKVTLHVSNGKSSGLIHASGLNWR